MTSDAGDLTVGRTAALAGVSVRTLHHWDDVGLVRPSGRTAGGYRVYSGDDVARLHRVLVYRELGFPLAEIGRILDDPDTDARDHLRRQRAQLVERISRLQAMVHSVDRMTDALRTGLRLTPAEHAEIFGAAWRPEWAEEAESRWGGTAEWAQYAEKAAAMSAQDWKDVAAGVEELNADLAAAMSAGAVPGSKEANALAERHRSLLSGQFDCTYPLHACIGRMFSTDPRFATYYDAVAPGLAVWFGEAITANAEAR
jgi:MerR family transcriptional regulator, thiopeptide resistance regulator